MNEKISRENINEIIEDKDYKEKKIKFFRKLALDNLPEMRLLFKGGKLWKKEKWRNVVEHCLVEAAVADGLSEILDLDEHDREELIKASFCHDWDKRMEKRPTDFIEDEKEKALDLLKKVNPDTNLLGATKPEFIEKFLKGETTFLERLQLYIDNITSGSNIMPFRERLAQAVFRNPENVKKFGATDYWEKNSEITAKIEEEIFMILKSKNINVNLPEEIPNFIRQKLEETIKDFKIKKIII